MKHGFTRISNSRRGMAIVLVLGLLAITLALAYATLRGQGTTTLLARNNGRALDARAAARSGLNAALRKISEDAWQGVGSQLTANVTDHAWYEVRFTTGDAQLAPGDPNYAEYPYRVTIDSVGYAADPADPNIRARHHSRCVVQLVRTALVPPPAGWNTLTAYSVYQWSNRDAEVQIPVRIHGPALIHGRMLLSQEYPLTSNSRERYLSDLNAMRLDAKPRGDHRPFVSPLTIALTQQSGSTLTDLQTRLGLVLVESLASTDAPLPYPASVTSYRLYPGGREYTIPVVQQLYGSTLQNVTLGPDPLTNPLGVFQASGALAIESNVRITGTLLSSGSTPEVQIYGTGVVLEPARLPRLYGSATDYQLPTALLRDDLRINPSADARISGLAVVWDEFELKRGSPDTRFEMQGSLLTRTLLLRGRDNWTMTSTQWDADLKEYNDMNSGLLPLLLSVVKSTLGLGSKDKVYFPEFMQHKRGFTVQPALTFRPDSSGVRPHWHDWSQPVFQKAPSDAGLRWDVIRWEDGL